VLNIFTQKNTPHYIVTYIDKKNASILKNNYTFVKIK